MYGICYEYIVHIYIYYIILYSQLTNNNKKKDVNIASGMYFIYGLFSSFSTSTSFLSHFFSLFFFAFRWPSFLPFSDFSSTVPMVFLFDTIIRFLVFLGLSRTAYLYTFRCVFEGGERTDGPTEARTWTVFRKFVHVSLCPSDSKGFNGMDLKRARG